MAADYQDGPGDGDQGLEPADAAHAPPVALAEEAVGSGGPDGPDADARLRRAEWQQPAGFAAGLRASEAVE